MVAQQMKVTGVVINEDDGEPVIGASIVVKGTTIGTITDLDGKFELETQKDAKLIISYVGLRTQETTAQQNMRIVLSSDSQFCSSPHGHSTTRTDCPYQKAD